MSIYKYELVAPITNRKKPYIDKHGYFIVPNMKKVYRYYIEVMRYNTQFYDYDYFLLLGNTKFDKQCRTCRVDDYCRLKIILHNNLKDYVINELTERGNINFNYIESEDDYDVYQVS